MRRQSKGIIIVNTDKYLILKRSKVQIGKSKRLIDLKYKALPAGKRVSKFGNTYYEHRRNRTDRSRSARI